MKNSTQRHERLIPIDIDRMKQLIYLAMQYNKPVTEAVYMHPLEYEALLTDRLTEYNNLIMVNCRVNGISVFSDPIVTKGTFFICEPGLFDVYKKLKTHPWVDKSYTDLQLQKIAAGLFKEQEKYKYELLNGVPGDFKQGPVRGISPLERFIKK